MLCTGWPGLELFSSRALSWGRNHKTWKQCGEGEGNLASLSAQQGKMQKKQGHPHFWLGMRGKCHSEKRQRKPESR